MQTKYRRQAYKKPLIMSFATRELISQIERRESYNVSWAWKNPRITPVEEEDMAIWDNLRNRWVLPRRR